jgi:PAS domain-containing protein
MELKDVSSGVFHTEVEKDVLQLNALYATFSRIYQVIVTVHDKDEIYQRICEIAVDYGKLHLAWFGLIDSTGQQILPVASARIEKDNLKDKKTGITPEEMSMCPKVQDILEGKCIFCMDIATDPHMTDGRIEALRRGIHSSVTVPILENSKVIGAFTTYSFAPMLFGEQEMKLFEEIGLAISFALDLIDKEKQRNIVVEELEKSEERFREMFDNAPMAYHELDNEGHIIRINNTELAMLGYSAEEVIGQYSWQFVSDKEASHQRVLKKLTAD